jgi:hypothetical protein
MLLKILILHPIGLLGLSLGVIADPKTFTHGCGTGCAVRARLIGPVTREPGEIKLGQFRQEVLTNGKVTSRTSRYYWAICSTYAIASNDKKAFPQNRGWIQLDRKDFSVNYTTSRGGLGYYFDVLCPSNERL